MKVTNDEIEAMLAGATPGPDARLIAAAPDLAREVLALRARVAELEASIAARDADDLDQAFRDAHSWGIYDELVFPVESLQQIVDEYFVHGDDTPPDVGVIRDVVGLQSPFLVDVHYRREGERARITRIVHRSTGREFPLPAPPEGGAP